MRAATLCAAVATGVLMAVSASAERLPVRVYTTADGLPNEKIWRIRSDSRGFLWFATSGGLARYDGAGFQVYGAQQGLSASVIDVVRSRSGGYWIASNGQGVVRFLPDAHPASARFAVHRLEPDSRANYVNTVFEDHAGRVWAGTDSGLWCFDGADRQPHRIPLDIAGVDDRRVQVWALFEAGDRTLWIGTSIGLVRRHPDGRTIYEGNAARSTTPSTVFAILRDRRGRVWVASEAALLRFDGESARQAARNYATDVGGSRPFRALLETSDGTIWAAGGTRVAEIRDEAVTWYGRAQGFVQEEISALAEDSAGNLWIGTMGRGAMRLARNGLVTYDEEDGLGSRGAGTIFAGPDGSVFAVTADHVINRFEQGRFRAVRLPLPHPGARDRRRVLRDHLGDLWVITDTGIARFAPTRQFDDLATAAPRLVYGTGDGLASDNILYLFEDSRGDVWIGYRLPGTQVLTRWDRRADSFHHYSDADGLPAYSPAVMMAEDRGGAVWIAFWNGGLARYRDGRFHRLTARDGLPAPTVGAVHVDGQGRVWFGSGDGLGRIDDPDAAEPEVSAVLPGPFPCGSPQAITEDDHGNLYLGGVNGLDRLDPASGVVRHESAATGLASNEVISAFRDRDGGLWFGTSGGVSRFRPHASFSGSQRPALIFGVVAGGRRMPVSDLGQREVASFEVPLTLNDVRFEFGAVDLSAGDTRRYRYRLDGADNGWTGPTLDRAVQYASLAPGVYRFIVQAIAADGTVIGDPASVGFSILPPVWRRWWFLAALMVVVAAVLAAVHRARVSRLLAVERVRTRIAADLHDEVGSSLSRVVVLSEVVKGDLQDAPPDVARRLDTIAASARDLLESNSDLVWSIHPQREDLSDLLARVRTFAGELLGASGIEFRPETPSRLPRLGLAPDLRWHLLMIVKEALHNVVAHAHARTVVLAVGEERDGLFVEIRDDGQGFVRGRDGERSTGGQGLNSMTERARAAGVRLSIDSRPGKGTTVRVVLAARRMNMRWGGRRKDGH